ncbi:DNA-directed RNA polymerase subunit alpha [Patescibacteria group bacterium]|nr:DNA-directed RNA polymerase subunit alpha [Patescibacteria group bacterium]MBU1906744.1 DNA-directed RNA polymerase subunit alpha [Patescibacteria group bacterium]
MENILLPSKINFEPGSKDNEGILVVEPCYYGYGTTLGNALRRVLLSSLPGAAVTAVKITGATHEFATLENVKEDVLEIILNIKGLRLKMHVDEPVKLNLKVTGLKDVTAKDIDGNADVDIVNPEMKIATLTDDKAEFEMELTVERGRGFYPTEERKKESGQIGTIAVDALFSPVRNVAYKVEPTRVGEITNFDKLVMTIETDGSITPEEAVLESGKILMDYFQLLTPEQAVVETPVVEEAPEPEVESEEEKSEEE